MGTESLPQGIIAKTSNLETQHLWNYDDNEKVVKNVDSDGSFYNIFVTIFTVFIIIFCSF